MRNVELIDKRFQQIESRIKTLEFMLSRPGTSASDFKKELVFLSETVTDLKEVIEREATPLRNG